MGDVFDLDALRAEATGEAFSFSLAGEQFTVPAVGQLDRKVFRPIVAAFEAEDIDGALRLLLGEEDWARLDVLPMTVEQQGGLIKAYFGKQGFTSPGESQASPAS